MGAESQQARQVVKIERRNKEWAAVSYYGYGDGEVEVGKFQLHFGTGEWSIWGVEVYDPYKGLGHGREMMKLAFETLKGHKATKAYLYVDKKNHAAVSLYASLGFKVTAEWASRGAFRMEVTL
jgi:ribosomal protein S18 acetylase RimI-like enzyme